MMMLPVRCGSSSFPDGSAIIIIMNDPSRFRTCQSSESLGIVTKISIARTENAPSGQQTMAGRAVETAFLPSTIFIISTVLKSAT